MTGPEVRALRERLGLTQQGMAQALGVSFTTINRWEKGKAVPRGLSITALERLARKAPKA